MVQGKNYYLGLDIGTDSVGYAVADRNYTLLKRKGEPMWGTHLFEGGRIVPNGGDTVPIAAASTADSSG